MRLSVPASILLASVIMALGLYFGLRAPTAAPTPSPSPAEPVGAASTLPTVSTPDPTPVPIPGPPPPPSDTELAAYVADEVTRAHPVWKAACWDTADPATRKPGRYTASLAFGPNGKLTVSGVGEADESSDPSVGQCMSRQVNAFSIPAPGHPVAYQVPFRMP